MKNFLTTCFVAFAFFAIQNTLHAQVCNAFPNGGPYTDIEVILPCEALCGTPTQPAFDIWQNESYILGILAAGDEYIFDIITGADVCGAGFVGTVELAVFEWDPVNTVLIGTAIAFESDVCTNGALAVTIPNDGEYILFVSDTGDCNAVGATDSGLLSIDCGPNGATCPPCVFDVELVDAIALTTTTDITLASYCYNDPSLGFTFESDTITIAFGTLSGAGTDFAVTTNVGIDAGGGILAGLTIGFVLLSQTDLDNSGGTVSITMTGINNPECVSTLDIPVAGILQGNACLAELCEGLPCTACTAMASTISTTDPTRICIDGIGDPINVSIDMEGGATSAWVITDANGIILALPPGPPFDLDGAGAGQCLIWYVNFDDPAFNPMVGDDAAALVGASSCAFLSNPITVDRIEVTAPTISTTSQTTICADDGIDDLIDASIDNAGIGANSAWVITDANGIILALPPAPPFNLEGAGAGTCLIWYVNWDDPTFAPVVGDDATAAVAASACAILSNPITVTRETDCGAMLMAEITDPCNCVLGFDLDNDGINDIAQETITITDPAGAGQGWALTGNNGNLVGIDGATPTTATVTDNGDGTYTLVAYVVADGASAYTADFTNPVGDALQISGGPCNACPPPLDEVPTVGEWGLIILGLLMTITAVVGIRQRRKEESYG